MTQAFVLFAASIASFISPGTQLNNKTVAFVSSRFRRPKELHLSAEQTGSGGLVELSPENRLLSASLAPFRHQLIYLWRGRWCGPKPLTKSGMDVRSLECRAQCGVYQLRNHGQFSESRGGNSAIPGEMIVLH